MGILFAVVVIVLFVIAMVSIRAAYRNGVNDGYGYAKEPWNIAYDPAGDIVRQSVLGKIYEPAEVTSDELQMEREYREDFDEAICQHDWIEAELMDGTCKYTYLKCWRCGQLTGAKEKTPSD